MKSRIALGSLVTMVALALVVGSFAAPTKVKAEPAGVVTADGTRLPDDAIVVEKVIKDGDRAILQVRNRTPFIIIVYIGGVRIGWMRPYRVGMMRGLMNGYHQMYAHSRYGTTSWGPRPIWVPGTWNLLY